MGSDRLKKPSRHPLSRSNRLEKPEPTPERAKQPARKARADTRKGEATGSKSQSRHPQGRSNLPERRAVTAGEVRVSPIELTPVIVDSRRDPQRFRRFAEIVSLAKTFPHNLVKEFKHLNS
jgi:hypothetical protein